MGKYSGLAKYLRRLEKNKQKMSFEEVEEILGFGLPKSAREFRAWWANDETHAQARNGWLQAGWSTQHVDLEKGILEFVREEKGEELVDKPLDLRIDSEMTGREFEEIARKVMEAHLDVDILSPRRIEGIPKLFDLVSKDREVVGEAKFYSMVRGEKVPPAKFSSIAEHVWLLEKTKAERKFLVFGNDIRVPKRWLEKYGQLLGDVELYFIEGEGSVVELR